jgi:nucleoside 2-deoxyribosyltransferase
MLIYLASPHRNQEINYALYIFLLKCGYDCFLPEKDTPQNADKLTVDSNIQAIRKADIVLAVGKNIGNDTAWEVGFSKGLEKPVILLCQESDRHNLGRHLMTIFSVDQIVYLDSYDNLEEVPRVLEKFNE